MLLYIARRFFLMIVILFLVSIMVFGLINIIPGDPASLMLGQEATPQALASLRQNLGLNDPLYLQYIHWVGGVLQGNLGYSLSDHTPVLNILLSKIPVTLELTIFAFLLAVLIAVPAGIISAVHKGSVWDYVTTVFALSGVSIPAFWLGILLIYLLSLTLGWLPPSGYVAFAQNPVRNIILMIMPSIALGIRLSAQLTRMLRSSLLEVMQSDYIRTGYAKGLLEKAVVFKHALRNAMLPVLTVAGLELSSFLGGAVITETIFAVPGLGQLIVNAILTRDFPVVQGAILFMAFAVVIVNFLVDIAYSLLDPRISLGGASK
ncbi:ABC transporter permease [Sporolactobacillus kofuensis]|uniref:ABC transporter permease n=1 Tax=Sporolactobacillus kofuensis TaxID=269672 RepID=A0ABW1WES4_9BACL|nr:ABC transporter permease [Sporolactobacillus kofuensis]MCO7176333.1 ABC transporter permease [Sporolactobacillus kofuensis]